MTRRLSLTAAALVFYPTVALCQAPAPPPKHEATGEVAFVGVSGNASTNTFGVGFEDIVRPTGWVVRQRLAFVRNESDGTPNAQSFLYTPRAEKTINARLSAFGEYQYFRDRFAGVAHRNMMAAGLSAKLVNQDRHKLAADFGLGYLNETRLSGDDVSSAIYSAGTNYKLKLSDTAELADEVGVVGTFSRGEDWRVAHTIAVTAKLTDAVSLKVSNGIRFSNFPAPGFKKTDVITSVALVAKFKGGN